MVAFSRLRVLVPLLLLIASTEASILPLSGHEDTANLFSRQGELYSPLCVPSCDLRTCGSGGSCPLALSKRRWLDGPFFNNSDDYHGYTHALGKRLFTFNAGSTNQIDYSGKKSPTRPVVDTYLPAVDNGNENAYYGAPLPTVELDANGEAVDERAVSQQRSFGDNPFQIISSQVHGCTVIAVVSTRGVWMSHLWESYSSGKDSEGKQLDVAGDAAFNQRVLMFLRGQPVTNPLPNNHADYVAPTGPGIDVSMFNNKATDQTQVWIFTPSTREKRTEIKDLQFLRYRNYYGPDGDVYKTIADIFASRKPRVVQVPYIPLDTNNPAQSALLGTNSRGVVLFQYDPNSDGNGKRAWRLFMEDRVEYGNVQ